MSRILTKLLNIFQDHLYRNSIFLVLSRGLNATAGILFWVIAAKFYSINEVGMATVLISTLGLVMLFSRFGFDLSLIRYLEIEDKSKVFNTSLIITTIASAAISLIFIIFQAALIKNFANALLFMLIALCNSITLISGNMLLALRKGQYFFIQTILVSLRLFLLIPLAYSKNYGIFLSLGICYVLSAAFSLWVLRKEVKLNILDIDRTFVKTAFKFSVGSYLSNLLLEAPILILPTMVLHFLGEKEAAIYYIAMALGNFALIVPNALSISLFIEGSHGQPLKRIIMKAFKTAYLFLLPLTAIISFWGKNILGFIDKEYVKAYELLLLVIIATLFVVVYMVFIAVQGINMRVDRNVKYNLFRFLLLIGASIFLIPRYFIRGVGYAWLFTHVILTLIVAAPFVKIGIMNLAGRCKAEYLKLTKRLHSWWLDRIRSLRSTNQYILTQKTLLILLCISAVLGAVLPVLFAQYNLSILGIYLVIPMLAAPIIWWRLKSKDNIIYGISSNLNELIMLAFFICCLTSILILRFFPVRSIIYYILIALMGVMILTQILYSEEFSSRQSKIILMQIALLFLNIIWGVTLKYYFFIGRTDGLFHSWAMENLLQKGYIDQTFENYAAFPLWHILCSFIYQILDLPITPAQVMFITNGLIYGCLVVVIYLITLKFFNIKTALTAALFLCFNVDAVFYGMYSIPRSTVFFLEGILIFLLIQKKTYLNSVLYLLIMTGLIMYHTASIPFILSILVLLFILQSAYRVDNPERYVNLNFLLLLFVSALTYLMYSGTEVFNSISGSLVQKAPTGVLTRSIVDQPLQELFNYLQYSPLLLFIILGVLWGLGSSELKGFAKIILIIGLVLVSVTFPGPALLLNKLAGNFNLARFGEYSYLFFCIAGAAGLSFIFYKMKTKLVAVILFFIMAFLTVSNDFTASDNPIIKRPFYTFYISEDETKSLNRVAEITDGIVLSDYVVCRYLENSEYADKVNVLEVNLQQQEFLRSSSDDIILIRSTELVNRPLKLFNSPTGEFLFTPTIGDKMEYYTNDLPVWNTLESLNIVYDSGDIRGFQ